MPPGLLAARIQTSGFAGGGGGGATKRVRSATTNAKHKRQLY